MSLAGAPDPFAVRRDRGAGLEACFGIAPDLSRAEGLPEVQAPGLIVVRRLGVNGQQATIADLYWLAVIAAAG
jgi:hypothetical protein